MMKKHLANGLAAAALAAVAAFSPLNATAEDRKKLESLEDLITEDQRAAIERFLELSGPLMERFMEMIETLPRYEAPEILPNGDIIIRRKRDEYEPNSDESMDL